MFKNQFNNLTDCEDRTGLSRSWLSEFIKSLAATFWTNVRWVTPFGLTLNKVNYKNQRDAIKACLCPLEEVWLDNNLVICLSKNKSLSKDTLRFLAASLIFAGKKPRLFCRGYEAGRWLEIASICCVKNKAWRDVGCLLHCNMHVNVVLLPLIKNIVFVDKISSS